MCDSALHGSFDLICFILGSDSFYDSNSSQHEPLVVRDLDVFSSAEIAFNLIELDVLLCN